MLFGVVAGTVPSEPAHVSHATHITTSASALTSAACPLVLGPLGTARECR